MKTLRSIVRRLASIAPMRRRRASFSARKAHAMEAAKDGDWRRSAELWSGLLERYPDDVAAADYAAACRALRLAGQSEVACAQARRGLALHPRNVPLLAELAVADNFPGSSRPAPDFRAPAAVDHGAADIIICVYNALDDFRLCIESVLRTTNAACRIIIVDDCSDQETARFAEAKANSTPRVELIRNSENVGLTRSLNVGLSRARAEWVVLLNSDTIVTENWLETMLGCVLSDSRIKAVGPLSNAATVQSVPSCRDGRGRFVKNQLPGATGPDDMAKLIRNISERAYPSVPVLNGFCMLIHGPTARSIGYFNEKAFPRGYGEETEFCLKLIEAGHRLAIADDTYVYHSKTKSFSIAERKKLVLRATNTLKSMWPDYSYTYIANCMEEIPSLSRLRANLKAWISRHVNGRGPAVK